MPDLAVRAVQAVKQTSPDNITSPIGRMVRRRIRIPKSPASPESPTVAEAEEQQPEQQEQSPPTTQPLQIVVSRRVVVICLLFMLVFGIFISVVTGVVLAGLGQMP